MENTCLNCGSKISENFCSNCGQKKFKRIDKKYLFDELQYSVIHTNKGFFYSIKKILKNPGQTAREFIDGNRVNHYKPIGLAFIISGISTFISFKIIGLNEMMVQGNNSEENIKFMKDYMSFFSSYSSIISLLFIPFFAIFTKLVFKKWEHNYYEHVIMNAFFQTYYTLIYIIILYPILYIFKENKMIFVITSLFATFSIPILLIKFFTGFYKEKGFWDVVLRLIFLFLIMFVIYIILIIGFVAYIFFENGIEGLKNLQPPAK